MAKWLSSLTLNYFPHRHTTEGSNLAMEVGFFYVKKIMS
jgi:hypothetical protein